MVLPNVITPDNNGNNDRFMPFVPGHEDKNVLTMLDTYQIQVYNRWGDVLFQNNGMPLQWDGRANGQVVDAGTYIVSSDVRGHLWRRPNWRFADHPRSHLLTADSGQERRFVHQGNAELLGFLKLCWGPFCLPPTPRWSWS